MKIKSRLKLNTWFSLGAIGIMILTLGWSLREINRADRNVLFVDDMRKAAYERVFQRDDFLLNPNEKAKTQWYAQSETLRALLDKADEIFSGSEDRALIEEARQDFEATFSTFSVILEKWQAQAPIDGRKTVFIDAGSPLTGRVFKSAYALNDQIVKLHESAREASAAVRNKVTLIIVLFVIGIVLVIVVNSIFISRIVAKRVAALDDGVARIGGGDLDLCFDETGHDELSDLARASNLMIAKMRESQVYIESLVDTVREPLIALDQDLRVVTVSRSFYDFFKVKPEETVGHLIYDLGNKQWDIPKLRELLETILPQKAAFDNYEVEHDFAGVGRRIMLLNARQIQRAFGKERIILLAIEDITERKAIEAGLEKTRRELAVIKKAADEASEFAESVINTVREPLISLDQDLRVVTVSRSFYEFFKVKPEETVGQLIYDLGNKQWDIPKLRELLETILPQKTAFDNYEVEHDFAGVGRRTMLLNARQIQQVLGKERIILLAIEDITERKAIEAGLEQTRAELETANKELGAFTYSVSHDLRAPLRGVIGFSHILVDEYAAQLSPEIQRYLGLVLSNTQQMGRLVDDLLSFSRFSRQAMAAIPVDPAALVREALDLLGGEQQGRSVRIKVGDLPLCQGDRGLLKQVFVNLISNALKFTRQRDPAIIEIGSSRKDGQTVYFVRDNGAGFDMRYVGMLFGVFQRLHAADAYEGTGVGLAIVQRIVMRHGGRVWAEGELDKGATFYFTLGGAAS